MVDNTTSEKVFVPTPENLAYIEGLQETAVTISSEIKWREQRRSDPNESHRHHFLDGGIAALKDLQRHTDNCIEWALEEGRK